MVEPSFPISGWRCTGDLRIRASWFLGIAIVEELWECLDGTKQWRRARVNIVRVAA